MPIRCLNVLKKSAENIEYLNFIESMEFYRKHRISTWD